MALAGHGTSVVCVGAGGVRAYAGILPDSLTTHRLEQQVAAWSDPTRCLDVACTGCASRRRTA